MSLISAESPQTIYIKHIYTHTPRIYKYTIYIYTHTTYICTTYIYIRCMTSAESPQTVYTYGVATVSRIDKITGLFCKRALQKRRYSAKETNNFIDPTDRSHPIYIYIHMRHIYIYTPHIYIHTPRIHTYTA